MSCGKIRNGSTIKTLRLGENMEEVIFTIKVELEEEVYQQLKEYAEFEGITLSQAARCMILFAREQIFLLELERMCENANPQ